MSVPVTSWKDAFGADLAIGSLVAYTMKRDGGSTFALARIVGGTESWVKVELDGSWLKERNAPYLKAMEEMFYENASARVLQTIADNLVSVRPRTVSPLSLLLVEDHPVVRDVKNAK